MLNFGIWRIFLIDLDFGYMKYNVIVYNFVVVLDLLLWRKVKIVLC